MKVILLKDVAKVGKKDEIKEVSQGYAQNLLIPRGLVKPVTLGIIKQHEIKLKEKEIHKKVQEELTQKTLDEISGKSLSVKLDSNEKGHLFKAIHEKDVKELIKDQFKIDINEKNIRVGQVKELGEHDIKIEMGDRSVNIKLIIK